MAKQKKRYSYVLRMPDELGSYIKKLAKENRRKIGEEFLIAIEEYAHKNKKEHFK